jgi:hypothetical protein
MAIKHRDYYAEPVFDKNKKVWRVRVWYKGKFGEPRGEFATKEIAKNAIKKAR